MLKPRRGMAPDPELQVIISGNGQKTQPPAPGVPFVEPRKTKTAPARINKTATRKRSPGPSKGPASEM